MRREGRVRGWVRSYAIDLVDPEGKQRRPSMAHTAVQAGTAVVANGGFVRAPRKPTNHSKPSGGRAFGEVSGKAEASSCKGRRKFKHDELKMYYHDADDAVYGRFDYLYDFDSSARGDALLL